MFAAFSAFIAMMVIISNSYVRADSSDSSDATDATDATGNINSGHSINKINSKDDKFLNLRNPTIKGLVVMPPGNFDSNTCLNNAEFNGRYNGGGFYVQNKKGSGIWVCPKTPELVNGIAYGDIVEVKGQSHTDYTEIFAIIADSVTKKNGKQKELIDIKQDLAEFQQSNYGDLTEISGFVIGIPSWGEFPAGSVFFIQDCSGNVQKGWWTASIDNYATTAEEIFELEDQGEPGFVPSYFKMVGFAEHFYPINFFYPNDDLDLQPRFVDEIVKIEDAPCPLPSPF